MSDSSRRGFLIVAGTGALAAGAAAMVPAAFAAGPREGFAPGPREEPSPGSPEGPLVAYVSDLRKGEVSVMMGEREVIVHDRALCASLARALS